MELASHEPRMIRNFDDLDQLIIPGTARNAQTCIFNLFQQHVVDFVTVTMTLNNCRRIVQLANQAIVNQLALLCAETHGTAEIALLATNFNVAVFIAPLGNQRHNRVLTVWHKFRRVGVLHVGNMASVIN